MGLNFFCSVQKAFIIVLTAPMTDVIPLITNKAPPLYHIGRLRVW